MKTICHCVLTNFLCAVLVFKYGLLSGRVRPFYSFRLDTIDLCSILYSFTEKSRHNNDDAHITNGRYRVHEILIVV